MSLKARWKIPLVAGLAAVLLAGVFAVLSGSERPVAEAPGPKAAASAVPQPAGPPAPSSPAASAAAPTAKAGALDRLLQGAAAGESSEEPTAEYPVKMDELRAKLPDNLYWENDAPTKDPEVLQKRAEAQRKWNEIFGKIQSGDASEEEIHRYYDYRRKLSEDYIALATQMLTDYGERLPEQDKGLLGLSIRMHQDRLKEVPRQLDEAMARKQLQDQRREEWIRNGKKP
jgi:hypothetical protein